MNHFKIIINTLRIPLDFLAVIIAANLAYILRPYTDLIPFIQIPFNENQLLPINTYIIFSICAASAYVIISMLNNLYNFQSSQNQLMELFRIIVSVFLLSISIIAFYALFKAETFFSRGVLFIMSFITIILSFSFRSILREIETFFLKRGIGVRKIALIGDTIIRKQLIENLCHSYQYKVIFENNYFDEQSFVTDLIDEIWYIKSKDKYEDQRILEFAQVYHKTYRFIPDVFGTLHAKVEEGTIGSFPLLTIQATPLEGGKRVIKKIFDIIFASIILILISPILLIISLLIKIDSKGPIFYLSDRVGRDGKLFKMFKFRSMIQNADDIKSTLKDKNHRKDSPLFKIKNDPRVTSFGKFMRRYSIDELPQFFNVIIGNMSIVGPRPHLSNEVQKYSLDQRRVLMIKPGITGLSQINGRSDLNFEKEIQLDLHYIVNWSLLLDIKIIFKTPFVLLIGEGAD